MLPFDECVHQLDRNNNHIFGQFPINDGLYHHTSLWGTSRLCKVGKTQIASQVPVDEDGRESIPLVIAGSLGKFLQMLSN